MDKKYIKQMGVLSNNKMPRVIGITMRIVRTNVRDIKNLRD